MNNPRNRVHVNYWLRRVARYQLERDIAAKDLYIALKRADELGATDEEIRDAQNGKPPPDESEPYRGPGTPSTPYTVDPTGLDED
jgi:hypothetical protein